MRITGSFPCTCSQRPDPRCTCVDISLAASSGEPRLHLDEGTQAIWLVHPGGRMVRVEMDVQGDQVAMLIGGLDVSRPIVGLIHMPPATQDLGGGFPAKEE